MNPRSIPLICIRSVIKKHPDCVNNFCVSKDNETPIISIDKVTSNEYYTVDFQSIKIFIFIAWRFSVIVFQSRDEFPPDRPSTPKMKIVRNDRRLIIREVTEGVEISYGSCQEILTKYLGMSRIAAKCIPHLLTDEQKFNRKAISHELLKRAETDVDFF